MCVKDLPSKEDFILYERMRQSGNFNMFSPMAMECSGLDKATYMEIMTRYGELDNLYPDVRKGTYEKLELKTTAEWK